MKESNEINLGQPTHVAQKSGSWFDPGTWQNGRVPDNNANVAIASGVSVTYDGKSDARISSVDVDGQLKFATATDTKLVVETIVIGASGRLEIGTQANPVTANAEILIADNGPLNLSGDPKQLGRGLVSDGAVEIHGIAKTSHLKVAVDPQAGDRTLTLQAQPVNWQVGDRLVLTGTRFTAGANGQSWDSLAQDEEVVIQAIEGNRITLDRALRYSHDTPRGDLKAYVANQSRNIAIASENGDRTPTSQRGHTLFGGSNQVDIRYAEFRDLGRTDKTKPTDNFQATGGIFPTRVRDAQGNFVVGDRTNIAGRYAAHIHHRGTESTPAILVGNVVDGSPGWGFAVHDSSAILEENVAYDIAGGAFVTETGNETGIFRNNIAIKTGSALDDYNEKQGTGTHDFARSGVGFWFAGRLVENEGNVAAGSRGAGMFYFHRGVDLIPVQISDLPVPSLASNRLTSSTVEVGQPPIQNFSNNEVFASGSGLEVVKDFPEQHHDLRTVMDGFKAWDVEKGTEMQYTSHYTLKDFDLISAKSTRAWQNKGMVLQRNTQDMVFTNMRAEGFDKGIYVQEVSNEGPKALDDRGLIWVDLELANNNANFEGFDLPPEKWLTQANLTPGRLEFQLSNESDFEISSTDVKDYVAIRGVKRDSLGEIAIPFGDERLSLSYEDALSLADKGYYRLPDGSRGAVIESYFSDRITGDTKKYSFVVTFKESFWTDNSPYLGELNPNSLSGPTSVTVPRSRYRSPNRLIEPIAAESDSAIAAPFQADMAMLTDFSSEDDSLINSQGLLLPVTAQSSAVDEGLITGNTQLAGQDSALLAGTSLLTGLDLAEPSQQTLGSAAPMTAPMAAPSTVLSGALPQSTDSQNLLTTSNLVTDDFSFAAASAVS